jgi:small-conductance mechanosensitive channel
VIIPNADLITGKVKNWTLRDAVGRMKITINVAMDADLEIVRKMLMNIAIAHRGVLQYPKPFVVVESFTDNAATVSLNVFVGDVNQGVMVRSDLAIAMLKQLREANVKTPNYDPMPPYPAAPGTPAGPGLDGAAILNITVCVGLDADPELARDVLIATAKGVPGIAPTPPSVIFDGFGDGGIRLTLRTIAKDASRLDETRTDLAFQIMKALRVAGVPNASPEHHVKLADLDPFRKALTKAMEERARGRQAEDVVPS